MIKHSAVNDPYTQFSCDRLFMLNSIYIQYNPYSFNNALRGMYM